VKNLPILMFLGLIWCKILCWAQKSTLYGVWNATESHESPKTEFVSHEIFISRVTYPSIRNFKLNSKKYTLWGLKCNHKSWEPKNLNKFLFLKLMKALDMFSNIKAFGLIHVHRKFNCGYATHFLKHILWRASYYLLLFIIFISYKKTTKKKDYWKIQ
jgi:hypothetical protein